MWPTCVDLSCAVDMYSCQHEPPPPPPPGADTTGATLTGSVGNEPQADGASGGANKDADLRDGVAERSVIDKYARLRKAVARMGLERAWDMAPLLRVSEISIRPGYF